MCVSTTGNQVIYRNLGDYSKAIEHQQKTLDIAKEIGSLYDETIVQKDLGINNQNQNHRHHIGDT
jgi:hypothetical protein